MGIVPEALPSSKRRPVHTQCFNGKHCIFIYFKLTGKLIDWRSIKSIDWRSKAWLSCKRIGGENMKKIYFIFANK